MPDSVAEAPAVDQDEPPVEGRDGRLAQLGALALFTALRLVQVAAARVPAVMPDEPGTWATASWVAGGPTIQMRDMPPYPLVPGALLAPLWHLPISAGLRYRLALVLLGALTVAAAALVRDAVVRLHPELPMAGPLAFAVVLLFPATVATGAFTWAEPAVLLCWSVLLWGSVRCRDRLRWGPLVATSVVAGLAPFVHGRLAPVTVIWLVALAWRARRDGRSAVTAAGLLTIATCVLAWLVQRAVTAAVWTVPASRTVGSGVELLSVHRWTAMLAEAAGEAWYLLAATAGLAALGAWWLGAQVRSPTADGGRWLAAVLGTMMAATVAVSILTLGSNLAGARYRAANDFAVPRWDHLVYGRYIDAVALLLVVLGLPMVLEVTRRRTARDVLFTAAAAIGLLAIPVAVHAAPLALAERIDLTAAGVGILPSSGLDGLSLLPRTLTAVVLTLAMGVAVSRGSRAAVAAIMAALAVGSVAGAGLAVSQHRRWSYASLYEVVHDPPFEGASVVVPGDAAHDSMLRLNVFGQQYVLVPEGWRFRFVDRSSESVAADPPSGAALLVLADGAVPDGEGWHAVGRFGGVRLWRYGDG